MAVGTDCSDTTELRRAMLAEFLATTIFVFVGCGAHLSTGMDNDSDGGQNFAARLLPIALTFGLSAVAILYAIAPISGGHMNPAVSLFLASIQRMSPARAGFYILSQFLGAIFGAILLWACTTESGVRNYYLGANHVITTYTGGQAFMLEMTATFTLCFTVLFTQIKAGGPTDGKPNLSILCIGFAIFVAHIMLVPFTGCGMNPARTFGPALVGEMVEHMDDQDIFWGDDVWAFYLGPVCGVAITTVLYKLFYEEASTDENLMRGERSD